MSFSRMKKDGKWNEIKNRNTNDTNFSFAKNDNYIPQAQKTRFISSKWDDPYWEMFPEIFIKVLLNWAGKAIWKQNNNETCLHAS